MVLRVADVFIVPDLLCSNESEPSGQISGLGPSARIWDISTGRERVRLSPASAVAISPNGQWLATASNGGTQIWDVRFRGFEGVSLQHPSPVEALAMSPDSQWLATASADKTARIWDAHTGREDLRLEFEDTVKTVAFLRDGQLLAVAHGNLVTLEPWRTEDLVDELCARLTRNLTLAEWNQYLGEALYHRRTCPNLPAVVKWTTR